MLQLIRFYLVVLCLFLFGFFPSLASAAKEQIENIRVWHSPERSRIEFDLSSDVNYKSFLLSNPARLVVDFENTQLNASLPALIESNPHLSQVRTGQPSSEKLRFVFELKKQLTSQSTEIKADETFGHRIIVDLTEVSPSELKPEVGLIDTPKPVSLAANTKPVETITSASFPKRKLIVAIDAGHGGADPGALGYKGSREKDLTLTIAKKLKVVIDKNPSMRAVLIRDGDYFVDLHKRRVNARNMNADIFLSIHADAFTKQSARGFSVFALSQRGATSAMARALAKKENAVDLIGGVSLADKDQVLAQVLVDLSMTNTINESVNLGGRVLKELSTLGKLHSKRVEQAGFAVLKSPDMPSILIETGFITNPEDEKNLRSSSYQNKVVTAIYTAIDEYYQQTPYFSKASYASPSIGSVAGSSRNTNSSRPSVHVVKNGDSLSKISVKYNVTINALKRLNNLSRSTVYVGQKIKLPAGTVSRSNDVISRPVLHTVKSGDTLSEIAQKYGVSTSSLKSLNNLKRSTVFIGQKIKLPSSSAKKNASTPVQKPSYHKVRRGDTLSEIAQKYNMSIRQLKTINNLRSEKIQLGQRLKLSS